MQFRRSQIDGIPRAESSRLVIHAATKTETLLLSRLDCRAALPLPALLSCLQRFVESGEKMKTRAAFNGSCGSRQNQSGRALK
jgi:hypothetical protein